MKLSRDWLEFLGVLKAQDVHFVIVGGVAVVYHGYPRTTGDLDIFYECSPDNVRRLLRGLRSVLESDIHLSEKDLLTPGKIVQLGISPNRIDLINQIDGVSFAEASDSAIAAEFEPIGAVLMIGKTALIKNKKTVGRNRDKDDLEFLDQ
ncbi:MAG TPA: nucleotidyltransferase [Acidobacteriota bacterium]|nr:nucleotidyltransferase [Acidobacteriota bacterium]